MQRINLLYVITKLELGGAQKQLLSLISRLDKKRFNVFLFTAEEGLLTGEASAIIGLTLNKSRFLERAINPLKDILALIEIYRFIKKNRIEIVHTHSSKAGILGRLAAKLAQARVILHTVHGWSFNDYQPIFVKRIFIWLERWIAKFTHKIIVVSDYDREKGLKNRIGDARKYTLIRYGIDYSEFAKRNDGVKEELGIKNTDLIVGMISCFKPQKSPQDFIRLASLGRQSMLNVKYLLVGDGALRPELEKLILRFNLQGQVILAGWRKDIPRILSSIDVLVLTSLWEGLPISVLEAMASAKSVVATDTGGIREVLTEGKTGFLVSPGDINKMHERLTLLIKDENLRRSIGQDAKEALGPDFHLESMVNKAEALYENLEKEKGGAYVY